ncbi:MAG: hypothetical protein MUO57_15460, partial [Anaerolineales bacterium]|nr:hypothetical protein [Anaerolineales bacterium]
MATNQENDPQPPRSEGEAMNKTLRDRAPRKSHGVWEPASDRPDPISLLQAQDNGRIEQLLPI